MAYRQGNRNQMMMFPPTVEDFVSENHPVRVYDAFVEGLDFNKLDFKMNGFGKVGNPEYDPKSLLKVILYGYSYGERSSRRLERAIYDNIIFIWLAGGLKPDHVTIARFRKRNSKLLKKVFNQCAQLCIKLELIAGNTLFLDGTKIRASAGLKNSRSKESCQKYKEELDKRIKEILKECDRVDKQEQEMGSFVGGLREELNSIHKIKAKVERALIEIEEEDLEEVNITDPESRKMKGRQGTHPSYNAQVPKFRNQIKRYEQLQYRIKKLHDCQTCNHFGVCTVNKRGKSIGRHKDEKIKEALAKIYESERGQEIYKKRQAKSELVFGHIKHNLKVAIFMSRGLVDIQAEMNLLSTVFNLRRMISLLGTKKLIEVMALRQKPEVILGNRSHFMNDFLKKIGNAIIFRILNKPSAPNLKIAWRFV